MGNQLNMLWVWVTGWMLRCTSWYSLASKYPARPWHTAGGWGGEGGVDMS